MAIYPPVRGSEGPYNPYASPLTMIGRMEDEFGYPPLRFGVSDVISRSWAIFASRMGFCIGTTIGWFALYVVGLNAILATGPLLFLATNDPMISGLGAMVVSLVGGVALFWLAIGLQVVMVKVARGRLASFGDLFAGGPFLVPYFLASMVVTLLAFAGMMAAMAVPFLVAVIAGRDQGAAAVAMVLGVFLATMVVVGMSLRLSQFSYFVVGSGAGTIESLRLSSRATESKLLSLTAIFLIVGAINFLGALPLGLGLILTAPLGMVILAVTYTALADRPKESASAWPKPEAIHDF